MSARYYVHLPTLEGTQVFKVEAADAADMSRRAPSPRIPERASLEKRRPVRDANGKLRFEVSVVEHRPGPFEVAMEVRLARGEQR